MPGMDGLETLRLIRESDPSALVVMATAYASIELAVEAMKLGATDFVRKPMTPETLRNAVAAALAKPLPSLNRDLPALVEPAPEPLIETITMNGFAILDPEEDQWHLPEQRRFTVLDPSGARHEVVVQIDPEVVDYVRRLTGRYLPLESSFWTAESRRLLSDYLWNKGEVPHMKFLVLDEIGRDQIVIAKYWKSG
jgi:hypothetical protein